MPLRLSRQQAQAFGVAPQPPPSPRTMYDGYRSALEQRYAAYLAERTDVVRWVYEPWQFILSHGRKPVRYTPDFLVIPRNGPWEIHEVKGFWRPKDRVIIKLCADQWPGFRVLGVQEIHGLWEWEVFSGY